MTENTIYTLVVMFFLFLLVALVSLYGFFRLLTRPKQNTEEKQQLEKQKAIDKADQELLKAIYQEARYLLREIPRHMAMQHRWGELPEGFTHQRTKTKRRVGMVQFELAMFTRTEIWFRFNGRKLPSGVSFYDIANPNNHLLENLQYGIGRTCRFYEDTYYNLFLRVGLRNSLLGIPKLTYWRDVVDRLPQSKPFAVIIGTNEYNKLRYQDLTEWPHGLVLGTTGSGKSNQVAHMLLTLIMRNSTNNLNLFLFDFKKTELPLFAGLPHVTRYIEDVEDARQALVELKSEMDRRYASFKLVCKDIAGWNAQNPHRHLPRIFVFVDELSMLAYAPGYKKEIIPVLLKIVALGRAAGIHLVIATQVLSSEVLDMTLTGNMPGRICFKVPNYNASTLAIGNGLATELAVIGRCIFKEGVDFIQLQAPKLEEHEIPPILEKIKQGDNPENLPAGDFGITQLLEVALSNYGGIAASRNLVKDESVPLSKQKVERLLKSGEFDFSAEKVFELSNGRYILAPSVLHGKGKTPRRLIAINGHIPTTPEELNELITLSHVPLPDGSREHYTPEETTE